MGWNSLCNDAITLLVPGTQEAGWETLAWKPIEADNPLFAQKEGRGERLSARLLKRKALTSRLRIIKDALRGPTLTRDDVARNFGISPARASQLLNKLSAIALGASGSERSKTYVINPRFEPREQML